MFLHHLIVFTHVQERQIVQTAEQRVLGSTSASEHRQAGEKKHNWENKRWHRLRDPPHSAGFFWFSMILLFYSF